MEPSQTWNCQLFPFVDLFGLADPHHPPPGRSLRNPAATRAAFESTPSKIISSSRRMINKEEVEGSYSEESEGEETEEPAEMVGLEIAAHDRRVLLVDLVSGLLEHTCRAQGRWIRFVPLQIPVDRLNRSSPEAWALWKVIAEDPVVPHAREDASKMTANLGVRLMASMWEDLVRDLFAGLYAPVAGQDRQTPAVDRRPTGVEEYAWVVEKLVRRYGIFEALPTDPASHREYVLQLGRLAEAALELRDALVGQNASAEDEAAVVGIFGPGQRHGLEQSAINAECRVLARLEAAAGNNKGPGGDRVLTLCGGLHRRSRTPVKAEAGPPVCERRPVVATVRVRGAGLPMIQK